jgi:hypothetical protein
MQCNSKVQAMQWWTQGYTFQNDMLVLDLGAYDAILGVDWLKTLGDITGNWNTKTLSFCHKGERITLHGMPTPSQNKVTEVPVDQVLKWTRGNDI